MLPHSASAAVLGYNQPQMPPTIRSVSGSNVPTQTRIDPRHGQTAPSNATWRQPRDQSAQQYQYTQPQQYQPQQYAQQAQSREQYAAAVAQQQRMLQLEMLKFQAYQQVSLQNQYLAQAQAQLALLGVKDAQPGFKPSSVPQRRRSPSPGPLQQTMQRNNRPNQINLRQADYMSAEDDRSVATSSPGSQVTSSSEAIGTPGILVSAAEEGQYFPFDGKNGSPMSKPVLRQTRTPPNGRPRLNLQARSAATRDSSAEGEVSGGPRSTVIRQPIGPPVCDAKDLGELNFAGRFRRHVGNRLSGLVEMAQQRQVYAEV